MLILGAGGAGLFAALHAKRADPTLDVTIAVKGLLGKCGCTRMVQGGYNAALAEGDSVERHFMDTIEGGKWLPDQDLAWTLVTGAVERIHELENELGCFFDRNPDGTIHQKAFAGQTFDRTVHKGDLTGIEIVNRLAEQVWSRGIRRLEEHRALEFVRAADGALAGVLLVDVRTGAYRFVQAKAVLLATGGGPTMYRFHTPSGDKSCDGLAMALRLRTSATRHGDGAVPPDRAAGGRAHADDGHRARRGATRRGRIPARRRRGTVHGALRPARRARDARHRVAGDLRGDAGRRTSENGGVYLAMAHLGADNVRRQFKGMADRCADCGFDLAGGRVEVVPTAHYMMGGVEFAPDCTTEVAGLFVAGEDSGGVHGANRLGGNGVANSTVFGGIAGDTIARWLRGDGGWREPVPADLAAAVARAEAPLRARAGTQPPRGIEELREGALHDDVGRRGHRARCGRASNARRPRWTASPTSSGGFTVAGGDRERAFNLSWHDALNLASLTAVSQVIVRAAQARCNSRGAHYRAELAGTRRPAGVDVHAGPMCRARRRHRRHAAPGALHARQAGRVAGRHRLTLRRARPKKSGRWGRPQMDRERRREAVAVSFSTSAAPSARRLGNGVPGGDATRRDYAADCWISRRSAARCCNDDASVRDECCVRMTPQHRRQGAATLKATGTARDRSRRCGRTAAGGGSARSSSSDRSGTCAARSATGPRAPRPR